MLENIQTYFLKYAWQLSNIMNVTIFFCSQMITRPITKPIWLYFIYITKRLLKQYFQSHSLVLVFSFPLMETYGVIMKIDHLSHFQLIWQNFNMPLVRNQNQ